MAPDFPSDVKVVANAIVAGAFSDLCTVYASGQVAYDDFARLCAERAADLLGRRWAVAPMAIALGAYSWHKGRSDAWQPYDGFEHWFRDHTTWGHTCENTT